MPDGEVSFVARKVKGGDAADGSFAGQTKVITMQGRRRKCQLESVPRVRRKFRTAGPA